MPYLGLDFARLGLTLALEVALFKRYPPIDSPCSPRGVTSNSPESPRRGVFRGDFPFLEDGRDFHSAAAVMGTEKIGIHRMAKNRYGRLDRT